MRWGRLASVLGTSFICHALAYPLSRNSDNSCRLEVPICGTAMTLNKVLPLLTDAIICRSALKALIASAVDACIDALRALALLVKLLITTPPVVAGWGELAVASAAKTGT